jgi:Flp pilus assembly pilin Flp
MSDAMTALAVRFQNAIADLRDREAGQGLVEYLVLVALIALTLFAAILFFSGKLGTVFSEIGDIIEDNLPS